MVLDFALINSTQPVSKSRGKGQTNGDGLAVAQFIDVSLEGQDLNRVRQRVAIIEQCPLTRFPFVTRNNVGLQLYGHDREITERDTRNL